MDFFSHQDGARRNTRLLIGLYALSVTAIILAVYLLVVIIFATAESDPDAARGLWDPFLFGITALALGLLIGGGTLYKVVQLGHGGDRVAQLLGGTRIDPGSSDPEERRVLNVVEEMAIASGIAVPAVYLLEERGINAFAAGFSPDDAVIGVTRGCIGQLDRDELQGVVAHEFSHILYGDMRLNIRLMGVLHGILVIALVGYHVLRGAAYTPVRRRSSRDGGGGRLAIIALGAALMGIGFIGVFFARLIKSAVSRQREFLADAAAVQFTRNPAGIGGALRRIAGFSTGSRITHPDAEEASHLFFANGLASRWFSMMATHPALDERIRRIDPGLLTGTAPPPRATTVPEAGPLTAGFAGREAGRPVPRPPPVSAAGMAGQVGQPTGVHLARAATLLQELPDELRAAAHDRTRASALLAGFLLQPETPDVLARQRAAVRSRLPGLEPEIERLLPALRGLDGVLRLPLLDILFGTLRQTDLADLERLQVLCAELVQADGCLHLFEFTVERMLARLVEHRRRPDARTRIDFPALRPLLGPISVLLAALAREGRTPAAAYAAGMRQIHPTAPPMPHEGACTLDALVSALSDLERASPAIKRRLIDACAETVATDGALSTGEGELLRAVASTLDCPLPLLHGPETA